MKFLLLLGILLCGGCASFKVVDDPSEEKIAGHYQTFSGDMLSFLEMKPDHTYLGARHSHSDTDGRLLGAWSESGSWTLTGSKVLLVRRTTDDPYPAIPPRLIVARYKGDLILVPEQSYQKYRKGMPPEIYQWHFRRTAVGLSSFDEKKEPI